MFRIVKNKNITHQMEIQIKVMSEEFNKSLHNLGVEKTCATIALKLNASIKIEIIFL